MRRGRKGLNPLVLLLLVLKVVVGINHEWAINKEIIWAGKERDLRNRSREVRAPKGSRSLTMVHSSLRNLSNKRNLNPSSLRRKKSQ